MQLLEDLIEFEIDLFGPLQFLIRFLFFIEILDFGESVINEVF